MERENRPDLITWGEGGRGHAINNDPSKQGSTSFVQIQNHFLLMCIFRGKSKRSFQSGPVSGFIDVIDLILKYSVLQVFDSVLKIFD